MSRITLKNNNRYTHDPTDEASQEDESDDGENQQKVENKPAVQEKEQAKIDEKP